MALFRKSSDKGNEPSAAEGFVKVAKIKSLRPGIIQQAKVGKVEIALTNVNGNYYAFAAHCVPMGRNHSNTVGYTFHTTQR